MLGNKENTDPQAVKLAAQCGIRSVDEFWGHHTQLRDLTKIPRIHGNETRGNQPWCPWVPPRSWR